MATTPRPTESAAKPVKSAVEKLVGTISLKTWDKNPKDIAQSLGLNTK